RLHIRDRVTGELFLIYTSADISLLPCNKIKNKTPSNFKLFAANNLVPYPIIGADLISHYGLLPDLKGRRLIDPRFNAFTSGIVKAVSPLAISTVNPVTKFAHILNKFPEIKGIEQVTRKNNSDVCHHIITTGPPVSERPR
ncbi:hypothetical protein ALC62_13472, partial [Cyphomyrmex costatus]